MGLTVFYNDDESNKELYGVLYNWHAVEREIAPEGWHVPTKEEWLVLQEYLIDNGYAYDGSGHRIAKSIAAKSVWNSSSYPGTPGNDLETNNRSGFTGLPAGSRSNIDFRYINEQGTWWSSTPSTNGRGAFNRSLDINGLSLGYGQAMKETGFSVRLVKDNY